MLNLCTFTLLWNTEEGKDVPTACHREHLPSRPGQIQPHLPEDRPAVPHLNTAVLIEQTQPAAYISAVRSAHVYCVVITSVGCDPKVARP